MLNPGVFDIRKPLQVKLSGVLSEKKKKKKKHEEWDVYICGDNFFSGVMINTIFFTIVNIVYYD